jgi:hypothetical protein
MSEDAVQGILKLEIVIIRVEEIVEIRKLAAGL